jgi:hypothetical protein
MYAIIDWHYIGNIATGEGSQMPDPAERPRDLRLAFWRATARYFRNAPHVTSRSTTSRLEERNPLGRVCAGATETVVYYLVTSTPSNCTTTHSSAMTPSRHISSISNV